MKIVLASIALYLLLGIVSFTVRRATAGRPDSQLRRQVDAWWLLFPIVSATLALYPYGSPVLCIVIGYFAARELSALTTRPARQFLVLFAWVSGFTVAVFLGERWIPWALVAAAALLVLACFRPQASERRAWLLLLLSACSSSILVLYSRLPFDEGRRLAWLFYLFVVTALNDIGQYVAGKLCGRTPLAPTVSPNKTWQGAVGGVVVSVCVSLLIGGWLELGGAFQLVLFGAALSVLGLLGDLLFSGAKRSFRIKDFSNLIPGHGGVLDRVDSLVFTAPALYLFLQHSL